MRWTGRSDGTYELVALDRSPDDAVGSTVRLWPRQDLEHWLAPETVAALAVEYGSLLPLDVAVEVPLDGPGGSVWRRVTEPGLPWRVHYPDEAARQLALVRYCERTLGFTPLACIDLDVPLTGTTGVAFVLPAAVPPGTGRHRVYLKRMLVGERVDVPAARLGVLRALRRRLRRAAADRVARGPVRRRDPAGHPGGAGRAGARLDGPDAQLADTALA